eukprot:Rmarinus@m.19461
MGNILVRKGQGGKEERVKNKGISDQIRKDKEKYHSDIKLLLLGAGDSGKSTCFKQFRYMYGEGFSDDDRTEYKDSVLANMINGVQALLAGAEQLGHQLSESSQEAKAGVEGLGEVYSGTDVWTPEVGQWLKSLWSDPALKRTFEERASLQIADSLGYYLDQIDRINSPHYVPTVDDVFRTRVVSTGITEMEFESDGCAYRIVDVGGQRSERSKWLHLFEDVTAVIFFVALSEYNQTLYEDESVNRMHESLRVFDLICNHQFFESTPMILFLNKRDLFEDKIKKEDLTCAFPEYDGGNDYKQAVEFIRNKFQSINKFDDKKSVYPLETCATDTQQMQFVFKCVQDIVINRQLRGCGLLES